MAYATDVLVERLPRHIAIIMDGNGRWAKNKRMPRIAGHREGVKTLSDIVKHSAVKGIESLTVYAFSSENWKRPGTEVSLLMDLIMTSLKQNIKGLHENNVRLRFIGDHDRFSEKLQSTITEAENVTSKNTGLELVVAANYGGRWDIINALKIVAQKIKSDEINVDDLNEDLIRSYISMSDLPDPDLFIRTGGEKRISNFLLWQLAYTELYFTETLWPDFSISDFEEALGWFSQRERRFGRISDQIEQIEGA